MNKSDFFFRPDRQKRGQQYQHRQHNSAGHVGPEPYLLQQTSQKYISVHTGYMRALRLRMLCRFQFPCNIKKRCTFEK